MRSMDGMVDGDLKIGWAISNNEMRSGGSVIKRKARVVGSQNSKIWRKMSWFVVMIEGNGERGFAMLVEKWGVCMKRGVIV